MVLYHGSLGNEYTITFMSKNFWHYFTLGEQFPKILQKFSYILHLDSPNVKILPYLLCLSTLK
jgi:hypothetical protein